MAIDRDLHFGPISLTPSAPDRADPESGNDPGQRLLVAGAPWIGWLQWRFLFPERCSAVARKLNDAGDHLELQLAAGPWQLSVHRSLQRSAGALCDTLTLHNPGALRLPLSVELNLEATPAVVGVTLTTLTFAGGGSVELDPLAAARPDGADWELALEPGERVELSACWRTGE
jgi:hypothetical protein